MILVDLLIITLIICNLFRFSKNYKQLSFNFYLILLTSITGTMYENIYGDYTSYRINFNNLKVGVFPEKEIGFYILNIIIKSVTNNFNIAFYIYILIIDFLILKVIYKYCRNVETGVLIYVILGGYITATNITRQYIGLAIYFYSIGFLIEKKYIKFVLVSVIAFTFHQSVLIAIVLSIFVKAFNKSISKHFILYILIVNIIFFIEPQIRKFGIQMFYSGYSDGSFNYGSNILHYIVQLFIVLFYLLNKPANIDDNNKFFINVAVIAMGFTLLSQRMVLYARLADYFNVYHIIAIVNIICGKEIKLKTLYSLIVFIALIGYYILLSRSGISHFENHILDYFRSPYVIGI